MRYLDTHTLRRGERALPTPFRLRLDKPGGHAELTCSAILRHLPGKRLVCAADWPGHGPVVVKIFLAPGRAEHHYQQELQGLQAMHAGGIPTPDLLFNGRLADGEARLLVLRKMEGFENLSDHLKRHATPDERREALGRVVALIARLHEAGLRQRDIHPGNFLIADDTVLVIDGDDIVSSGRGPLPCRESLADLPLFFAQFPSPFDALAPRLTEAYATHRNWPSQGCEVHAIDAQIQRWRAWRLKKFLPKTRRACTAFVARQTWHRFMVCDREWFGPDRRKLLDDPEAFIDGGTLLKAGNSATVARLTVDGQAIVVKRYNIKNRAHALRRSLRPSRAMISWTNAHRLRFLGISTPRPLAVIEERWGIVRQRAYFIMAYQPGNTIDEALRAAAADADQVARLLDQVGRLLQQLAAARLSHGDFKATNFLLSSGRLYLLDLDGMRSHATSSAFERAFRKDLARLKRNWADLPLVERGLAERLPPFFR